MYLPFLIYVIYKDFHSRRESGPVFKRNDQDVNPFETTVKWESSTWNVGDWNVMLERTWR